MDVRWCALCQPAIEKEPLRNALRFIDDHSPILVLRPPDDLGRVKAFRLSAQSPIEMIPTESVNIPADVATYESTKEEILKQFHELALRSGFLFHPSGPLTFREARQEGPSRCYECKTPVSFELNSLGCIQCSYYVCSCGRCLCGYSGLNYRGQYFPQFPPISIARIDRVELVRVVKFCTSNA